MIPEFPKFKKLELADKGDIEIITSKFPPYSDFNFVSMWSWNVNNEMQVSILHGNLVVKFTDYITGKPFYSFLGDNKVNDTVKSLLELSRKEKLKPELRLLPEHSILSLDKSKYEVLEDIDNFDYIYTSKDWAFFTGKKFRRKRCLYNKFKSSNKNIKLLISSDASKNAVEKLLELDRRWAKHKKKKDADFDIKNEIRAVEKFFVLYSKFKSEKLLLLQLYSGDELVGFCISSIVSHKYVLCHFIKGDIKYAGVYEYMLNKYAENITAFADFVNLEQDLGIPSLRFSKNSLRPFSFLKKYAIVER